MPIGSNFRMLIAIYFGVQILRTFRVYIFSFTKPYKMNNAAVILLRSEDKKNIFMIILCELVQSTHFSSFDVL